MVTELPNKYKPVCVWCEKPAVGNTWITDTDRVLCDVELTDCKLEYYRDNTLEQ